MSIQTHVLCYVGPQRSKSETLTVEVETTQQKTDLWKFSSCPEG